MFFLAVLLKNGYFSDHMVLFARDFKLYLFHMLLQVIVFSDFFLVAFSGLPTYVYFRFSEPSGKWFGERQHVSSLIFLLDLNFLYCIRSIFSVCVLNFNSYMASVYPSFIDG